MSDLFGEEGSGLLDGYVAVRVDGGAAPQGLIEDLQGIVVGRWLSDVLRHDFEQACYGGRIYGPAGTFDGIVADAMPGYFRPVDGVRPGGTQLWQPDGRHPLGKWFADVGARLLPLPSPEVLDAVLRRHGIEGSREPFPVMKEIEGGFALYVHKPKAKSFTVKGVSRDQSLESLWRAAPSPQ